jgi:hypothetical protein
LLLDEQIEIRWNPNNIKYYQSKGYKFTKKGDTFLVNVKDLSDSSQYRVRVKCDYHKEGCKDVSSVRWADYTRIQKRNLVDKHCCSNKKCAEAKQKETNTIKYGCEYALGSKVIKDKIKKTNLKKYGTENPFASKEVQQKIKETNIKKYGFENPRLNPRIKNKILKTNLEKYGTENPFASEKIKEKIRKTNLERYGVESPIQNPEIKAKGISTCLKKYGVSNYGIIYSSEHKGSLSPVWKGGVKHHRIERSTYEYREWRKGVFGRDLYTCQCCGYKSGLGVKEVLELNAHHIKNWKDNEDLRYNINNGITLCEKCHKDFHSMYGKRNTTENQLIEFLNLDKKIC